MNKKDDQAALGGCQKPETGSSAMLLTSVPQVIRRISVRIVGIKYICCGTTMLKAQQPQDWKGLQIPLHSFSWSLAFSFCPVVQPPILQHVPAFSLMAHTGRCTDSTNTIKAKIKLNTLTIANIIHQALASYSAYQ